jgi:hypothetical protein
MSVRRRFRGLHAAHRCHATCTLLVPRLASSQEIKDARERQAAATNQAVLKAMIARLEQQQQALEVTLRAAREEEQRQDQRQRLQAVMERAAEIAKSKQATMEQLVRLEKTSAQKLQDIEDSKARVLANAADRTAALQPDAGAAVYMTVRRSA